MQSAFLKYFIADLPAFGEEARHVLSASVCLSADVNAAFDPLYPEVFEKKNAAMINRGVVDQIYRLPRQIRHVRCVGRADVPYPPPDGRRDVLWQMGELGKVDAGGGGTVAMYIANLNVDTVDLGVPVLSMHAPTKSSPSWTSLWRIRRLRRC